MCSGAVRWQTIEFAGAGVALGLRLVDALYVSARRAQPSGRRQVHAHGRPSAALVFRR